MKPTNDFSYVSSSDNAYIDGLYSDYLRDPNTVEDSWRQFFRGFDYATANGGGGEAVSAGAMGQELKVFRLINGYRSRGHLLSKTNPIRERKNRQPRLELSDYGLSQADLESRFAVGELIGKPGASLKEIIAFLQDLYCGPIGVEFTHINNVEVRDWFQERFEKAQRQITIDKKKRILRKLNEAVAFENFLHTKYVGQKRFSLEGGETTIPAIDAAINASADLGVEEVVIGMAHRGRLNVLANILGKTYEYIFNDFEGTAKPDLTMGDGDVKYHLGYSSKVTTPTNKGVYLKLMPNPSHLEAVLR